MPSEYTYSTPAAPGADPSSDPFSFSLDQINTLIKELLAKYSSLTAPQPMDSADDPLIQDYLTQSLGGAKSLIDSYSARGAASTSRRAAASSTNPALSESELQHQALKQLAAEYSKKFSEAVKNAQSVRNAEYGRQNDALSGLNDLITTRNRLLTSQTDWLAKAAEQKFNLDQASLQNDTQAQKVAQETAKLYADLEQQKNAADSQMAKENKWKALTAKARLASRIGKSAAGWTNADDLLSDRLGVDFGYYQPWQRKLDIRLGTGRK
jgi:hypothetical protein